MLEAYKEWVRKNRQWLSSFESLANTMTWFLPERFANSELTPETVSTLLGLVTVLNQHIIETAPTAPQSGSRINGHFLSGQPEVDQHFPWPLCVSVVKEVEVLVEMAAEYYFGKDQKWGPIASVETVKALIRLVILHKNDYAMLVDGGETKNFRESLGSSQPESANRRLVQRQGALNSSEDSFSTVQSRDSMAGFNSRMYPSELHGRAMQAMFKFSENVAGTRKPSWLKDREAVQEGTGIPGQYDATSGPDRPDLVVTGRKHVPRNKAFVAGEVMCISRPLLYVLLIWKYGLKSWRPWLTALSVDLIGMYLVRKTAKRHQDSAQDIHSSTFLTNDHTPLTAREKQELKRRQLLWALYAMRNPFFTAYTRRPLESMERVLLHVPLVGLLAGKGVELLFAVQNLYTYTAAS